MCYGIGKALMKPPAPRVAEAGKYGEWRYGEMVRSWSHFSNAAVDGKDVLDFGCGDGPLSFYLAPAASPMSITGVDLLPQAIERARHALSSQHPTTLTCLIEFRVGEEQRLPVADAIIDTILVFDCMEHIMNPEAIMAEWRRVLRPDGRVLIEWSPFKSPWGSHMQSLLPVPWAHVLFGERALFEAAERLYDDPDYRPRHWDLDPQGRRRPNRWRTHRRFRDFGYLNQLDVRSFKRIAADSGFAVERFEAKPIGGGGMKRTVGKLLLALPLVGEYATNFIVAEIRAR